MTRYWDPAETYELVLKIGKEDLTADLVSVNIVTSIDLPYQTFILQIFYDPNSFILEKLYGQTPILLTVNLLATSRIPIETVTFELMYLESNMDVQSQDMLPSDVQKDRKTITITTIPRKAYTTMSSYVNKVYLTKTLYQIITDICNEINTTVKYDNQDRNENIIDQVVIPPKSLNDIITYLDNTWGLFNGAPAFYCSYDNVLYIKNLTAKMRKSEKFIVYQLATDKDNSKVVEKCNDGKHFYTLERILTSYRGNVMISFLSTIMKFITKPKNKLFETFDINSINFAKIYGLIDKNDQVFFDPVLKQPLNKSVYTSHTGFDGDETFANSDIAKQISNLTDVSIRVSGSLKILNLMEVGEPIQVISFVTSKTEIFGKYILATSEIIFDRKRGWDVGASLHLIRTNRSLT